MSVCLLSRTTTALLDGLHDRENEEIWTAFDGRYRPILLGFLGRLGFSVTDSEDVAQEVMLEFVRAYRAGKYDRDRGSLRGWLLVIARSRAINHRRRRAAAAIDTRLAREGIDRDFERSWEAAWRAGVVREAIGLLRRAGGLGEGTLRAFEATFVQGMTTSEAATELGISASSVYVARHRCLERLRSLLRHVGASFEDMAAFGTRG